MVNLLAHFEGSELVDFIHFVNLLVHKLQVRSFWYILFDSSPLTFSHNDSKIYSMSWTSLLAL
jgi:hypothetical protein